MDGYMDIWLDRRTDKRKRKGMENKQKSPRQSSGHSVRGGLVLV